MTKKERLTWNTEIKLVGGIKIFRDISRLSQESYFIGLIDFCDKCGNSKLINKRWIYSPEGLKLHKCYDKI